MPGAMVFTLTQYNNNSVFGGLERTPWENGMFAFTIVIPPDFPESRPRVKFEVY